MKGIQRGFKVQLKGQILFNGETIAPFSENMLTKFLNVFRTTGPNRFGTKHSCVKGPNFRNKGQFISLFYQKPIIFALIYGIIIALRKCFYAQTGTVSQGSDVAHRPLGFGVCFFFFKN